MKITSDSNKNLQKLTRVIVGGFCLAVFLLYADERESDFGGKVLVLGSEADFGVSSSLTFFGILKLQICFVFRSLSSTSALSRSMTFLLRLRFMLDFLSASTFELCILIFVFHSSVSLSVHKDRLL